MDGLTNEMVPVLFPEVRRLLKGPRHLVNESTSDARYLVVARCSDRSAVLISETLGKVAGVIYAVGESFPRRSQESSSEYRWSLPRASVIVYGTPAPMYVVNAEAPALSGLRFDVSREVLSSWVSRGILQSVHGPFAASSIDPQSPTLVTDDGAEFPANRHGVVSEEDPRLSLEP